MQDGGGRAASPETRWKLLGNYGLAASVAPIVGADYAVANTRSSGRQLGDAGRGPGVSDRYTEWRDEYFNRRMPW